MKIDYKHAFITGGASGIGLGIADALAERGVFITIADVDEEALERVLAERPDGFLGVALDIQERGSWAAAKSRAEAAFGPVDILVNNAGITSDGIALADMRPESFDRMIGVDLVGVFNGISAFAADLQSRGSGHIVNTASVMGLVSGVPGMGAYSAAKSGVIALSEALRKELAEYDVGVSVLCPGFVASQLRKNSRRVVDDIKDVKVPTDRQAMDARTAGEYVVRGIAANLAYIFTHPEYAEHIEKRMKDVARDIEAARVPLD